MKLLGTQKPSGAGIAMVDGPELSPQVQQADTSLPEGQTLPVALEAAVFLSSPGLLLYRYSVHMCGPVTLNLGQLDSHEDGQWSSYMRTYGATEDIAEY